MDDVGRGTVARTRQQAIDDGSTNGARLGSPSSDRAPAAGLVLGGPVVVTGVKP